jgi:hypothetical protein
MPRSNRPRGRAREEQPALDYDRVFAGRARVDAKRDGDWNVQPLTATNAVKSYTCPGCGLSIAPGVAHLVTWRADGIMGPDNDLADRRHWHQHCWTVRR